MFHFDSIRFELQVVGFAADSKYRLKADIQFADVYHSAHRYSTGSASATPIVLPRSVMWNFKSQRPLLGRELLRLQGLSYDADIIEDFPESQLGDLAGNACPVLSWLKMFPLFLFYVLPSFFESKSNFQPFIQ